MGSGHTASPLVTLAAALDGGTDLLSQAVAVLRARPDPAELAFHGVDDPAELPVGAADRRLLAVHEDVVGRPLDVTASCPACGARSTLGLTAESVGPHPWSCVPTAPGGGLREPTYADLLACAADPVALLDRCRVGDVAAARTASVADLGRAEHSLAGPLRSTCAECGGPVSVDADVVTLVLGALAVVCAELDREVHLLASTYSWDLATIEALPDHRRERLAALASGVA